MLVLCAASSLSCLARTGKRSLSGDLVRLARVLRRHDWIIEGATTVKVSETSIFQGEERAGLLESSGGRECSVES